MRRRTATMVVLTMGLGCAQEEAPADAERVLAEVKAQFAAEGIVLDAAGRTVAIKAVVNDPPDPIEYVLIHRRGKRHEAMFWTQTKPSVLNAALLMLAFERGTNATFVEKDPPPTIEEIEQGADPLIITPPAGKPFWITVRWRQQPDDVQVVHCVEDLILDLATQAPVVDCKWIYLGGRMAALYKGEPEVFVADFEGNLVSVCYLSPDNHLATMAHERGRDDQNWWLTSAMPPPGTEVEFVFHATEPEQHQARRKRLAAERAAGVAAPGEQEPQKGGK